MCSLTSTAAALHTRPQLHQTEAKLALARMWHALHRASGAAKPSGRPPVMLSAIQRQAPQLFTAQKVSVVSKYITHLDVLPMQYQGAQVRPPSHCTSSQ